MSENVKSRFTSEQQATIDAVGRTIVSASAGSGKTTVMIEKIIRLIQSGVNVGEILAVTFTKKAASQMKEKLRKALIKTINDKSTLPERRAALKKQLDEVPSADISTIHSFCSKLIRSHFYVAGVDNDFRVINGEDAEGTAMKNSAIDELFEEGYEEQGENFQHLLSVYWRKKSDNNLRKILLETYEVLRNRADYKEYLSHSGAYDEHTFDSVCIDLFELLKNKCRYYLQYLETERAYFEEHGGKAQLALSAELEEALTAIIDADGYFAACVLRKPKFTAQRANKTDSAEHKAHVERLLALKEKIVKIYDDELAKTQSREEELERFLTSAVTARALGECLLRFDEKYAERKTERGALDYNDLEHKALELLSDETIVKELREKYRYVFVDEYQDVNPVQEAIISKVGGENLFLVGDVKQSIYGFRGSKSKFFVEKQKAFEEGEGTSLKMKSNFRSSDAVLDAVNSQFALAMTLDTSSVDYARDSYMERGGRYALNDGRVQIHLFNEEKEERAETRGVYSVKKSAKNEEKEEQAIAKTIRAIIEDERKRKWFDADTGEYKRVEYSDIAILSRKKKGQIAKTVAALAAEGIPVTAAAAINICEYAEIKTLIDILSLLDNGAQDVPLCSALLSAMGDLTANDLTEIRLAYPSVGFFREAAKNYALEKSDLIAYKLKKFYGYYEELRTLSNILSAGEILTKILSDTRMESRLLSRENGAACLKRIHRFIEETAVEEPLCVHEFLDRLRDLNYKIEFSENGGEDSVKVLTMHSSKGLEYPVVIVDNLNALFRVGEYDEALVEEKYGLAPRAFNAEKMTKTNTLLRRLHDFKSRESSIADELNLYYVALTRAKYALHMVLSKPSVLPDVRYAHSFSDCTDFSVWEKYFVQEEIFDFEKQERMPLVFDPNKQLTSDIMQAFSWRYLHTGYENMRVKNSATSLMKEDAPNSEEEKYRSLFDVETEEDKDVKRVGIAYHSFLEYFDFSLLFDENGDAVDKNYLRERVKNVCLEYREKRVIADMGMLSEEKLVEILSNPVFYRLNGMRLFKEQQFLVSLPVKDTYGRTKGASEAMKRDSGEESLFQGAIDLLAVSQDEAWIVDYKYSGKTEERLKTDYYLQLLLYRLAVSKILRLPMEKVHCSIVNIKRGFQVDMDESTKDGVR